MSIPEDQLDDSVGPRLTRALTRLADTHQPLVSGPPVSSRDRPFSRMLVAAVAAIVVVTGIVGLSVVGNRGDEPAATLPPSVVATTDENGPRTPPGEADPLRFSTALPSDSVAVIDPEPRSPAQAFRFPDRSDDFLFGLADSNQLFVLRSDGSVELTATVAEVPVPPSFFDDLDTVERDGVELYFDLATDPMGAVAIEDDRVLVISLSEDAGLPGVDRIDSFDDIVAEIAEFVRDRPLDELVGTDRLAPLPIAATGRIVVSYGRDSNDEFVQVVPLTARRTLTGQDVARVASMFGAKDALGSRRWMSSADTDGRHAVVEQVSPVDIITLVAPTGTPVDDLLAWSETLTFVTEAELDELGVEVAEFGRVAIDQEIYARAEEDWGRWQVTSWVDDGERCFGFGAAVWPDAGASSTPQSCTRIGDPSTDVLCLTVNQRTAVGVYLGAGALSFDEPPAEDVQRSVHAGPDGQITSFFVQHTEPNPIVVSVDGNVRNVC